MTTEPLENVNVSGMEDMPTPEAVQTAVPLSPATAGDTVTRGRATVRAILDRTDPRLFVVIGPCSIHDRARRARVRRPARAARRARRRLAVSSSCASTSRSRAPSPAGRASSTTRTWTTPSASTRASCARGGSSPSSPALGPARRFGGARPALAAVPRRPHQLVRDRRAHHRVADPPRDGERAVGAGRLQERHRRRAGGRGKRDPSSALQPHSFLGINRHGRAGDRPHHRQPLRPPRAPRRRRAPNYDTVSVRLAEKALAGAKLAREHRRRLLARQLAQGPHAAAARLPRLRAPDPRGQPLDRRPDGRVEPRGRQPADPRDLAKLKYGVSVTDACVDWETTEEMLLRARDELARGAAGAQRLIGADPPCAAYPSRRVGRDRHADQLRRLSERPEARRHRPRARSAST